MRRTTTLVRTRRPTPPGEILRELFLKDRGVTVSALAAALKVSRKHASEIVNGRTRIEPAIAARLAAVLGTSARLWLNLQAAVDAWDAERETRNWRPGARFPAAAE
jgi:addiction module HigA family antidote